MKQGKTSHKGEDSTNSRLVRAGMSLMANPGLALKKALIDAGYSESTARSPGRNGITAERCKAAAWAAQPKTRGQDLLRKTRRLLDLKLEKALASPKHLDAIKPAELARLLEVGERFYGDSTGSLQDDARGFVDRAQWLATVVREMQDRGVTFAGAEGQARSGDSEPVNVTAESKRLDAADPGQSEGRK